MSASDITVINPLGAPMRGSTHVPGDKSISHRAVLFSAMAEGTSRVSGVLDSADVRSSIGAVRALGAQVSLEKQPDGSLAGGITGWGAAGPSQPEEPIDCGNSGTTVRLLMGILAPWPIRVTLTGDASLQKRPMRRITAPLMKMGAHFEPAGQEHLPITVAGGGLRPITYDAPMASAQLKTAVLLAGMYANGTTTLNEPAPSRNHTELMLPEYGVATTAGERTAGVTGPAQPQASEVLVPGDPSSAAFLVCAAVMCPGSTIQVENVSLNTARIGFTRTLERMGADVTLDDHHAIVRGVDHLEGAPVSSTDLRAGAALVLAGIVADGETSVHHLEHIDRGYEDYVGKLASLGADIRRVSADSLR